MRPISSPDAFGDRDPKSIKAPVIRHLLRKSSAVRRGVFVRRKFHSVIVVVGTSVANHVKKIPHVGAPIVVRPSRIPLRQLGQVVCGSFSCKESDAEEAR